MQLLPGKLLPGKLLPGKLLPGKLLPGKLLLGKLSPSLLLPSRLELLPGLRLLPCLVLLSALSTLSPLLDPLPGLIIMVVMMVEAPILFQEPTIRTISTSFIRIFLVNWTNCRRGLAFFCMPFQASFAYKFNVTLIAHDRLHDLAAIVCMAINIILSLKYCLAC